MLKIAVELHAFDSEGGLVAEDAEKCDRVVARVTLAVHVKDALRLRRDEERNADRERDVLRVRRPELLRSGTFDDQRLTALERLPRDRCADRDARPHQPSGTRGADDKCVPRGIDSHQRSRLVGDRLVSRFEDEIEQLVGARGVPDAHRRALEGAEQCGGGQVGVDDSTRPLRTA